ncbi:MAG: hypothetical protein JWP61_2793 [Friedmanniella sp.]|nr:hypothetical protein [Friedmanniella sp.]
MADFRQWFRKPTLAERLERFGLRPDVLAAAQTMVSDQRTDQQLARLGASLTDQETVLRMVDGRYDNERGLLVLTDRRIFFRGRRSEGPVALSVPLPEVHTVEGKTHKVIGTVVLTCPDGTYTIDDILGNQGETLAAEARQVLSGTVSAPPDPIEELLRLRALRDSGSLSAADFEARKRALWDGI